MSEVAEPGAARRGDDVPLRASGRIVYKPPTRSDGRGYWLITAEPHVIIRLKRIFMRVDERRPGLIAVIDTPETARDLEMVTWRWVFEIDEGSSAHLARRSAEHLEREKTFIRIVDQGERLEGLRAPAVPAREYQLAASDLVLVQRRLLLGDQVGLGKTLSGLLVMRDPRALPAVVVTMTHLPRQWATEMRRFLPWLRGHVVHSTTPYDIEKAPGLDGVPPDVLFLGYSKLAGWGEILAGWARYVCFDEIQELRRNDSQRYAAAQKLAELAEFRLGLTATPVMNWGSEAYNIISILDPDVLGSPEEFRREWGGRQLDGGRATINDPRAFGIYLREQGIFLRRTRKEVGRELPEVTRVPHPVESDTRVLAKLSGDAVTLARQIVARSGSNWDQRTARGDIDWRMRMATGVAKAPYVADFVRMLLESGEPVVLYGWHREVYDIWMQRLADKRPALYTGSESPGDKEVSKARFLSGDSDVIIISLRSGAGLDGLQHRARIVVFGELDWSPGMHEQCIGRLHRDGQKDPVVAYFLISDEGSDPIISDVLQLKEMQSELIHDPDKEVFEPVEEPADHALLLAEQILRAHGIDPEVVRAEAEAARAAAAEVSAARGDASSSGA